MVAEKNIPQFLLEKIKSQIDISCSNNKILDTTKIFNLEDDIKYDLLINLEKVNNIRWINKFHEAVNENIAMNGLYVSCAETLDERGDRIRKKIVFGFKNIVLFTDFIYKRVFPKVPIIKKIYFSITKGFNRVMSKAEILGRLVSCGFEIIDFFEHKNILYVISKKVDAPKFDMEPSYGLLFKMKRVGYKGKIIGVYKLRTMYPYSEYCQKLIYEQNKLADSGKINQDYRLTKWGKFLRKYWIDELPMIINFIKGELSLVGVRPLSENYFNLYPKDLQSLRILIKPGLIPPYYADLPKDFDEILISERKYIEKRIKSPYITNIRYFIKIIFNIIFKGVRSE